MTESECEKSELALAIEQRERKLYPFDVQGFLALGDREVPKLEIRALTKSEENLALVAAHVHAKAYAKDDADTRGDTDLLDDLKLCEALQRACFVAGDKTKGGHPIQAFPGGKWMEKHNSSEQIAVLHNLLMEVRKAESPMLWDIDMETVLSLAEGCAKTRDGNMPEVVLASCSREYMTTAFTLLAGEWWQLKQQQEIINNVIRSDDDGDGRRKRGEDDQGAEATAEADDGRGESSGGGGAQHEEVPEQDV